MTGLALVVPGVHVAPRRGGRAWQRDVAHFLATTDETCCCYCEGYVDRDLPRTHPRGASVDHEIPLMLGGPELVRDGARLRLAHLGCNSASGSRMRAKLAAVPRRTTSRDW